jgi:mono/diheme cytochrome c family protein
MKMKLKAITRIVGAATVVFLMHSCVADADSSGLEYMPDMYRSPAIEPYVDYAEVRGRENSEKKMMLSAMTPPANTIPFVGTDKEEVLLMLPYKHKANIAFKETHGLKGVEFTTEDTYSAAAADANPLKLTKENVEGIFKRGKELYVANCMHCHGEKGDGNGPMMKSGAYAGVPDYKEAARAALSDGQIFYSIYYGKGAMGSHASQVNKKEIWTLVHYVRKFQDDAYGKFDIAAPVMADSSVTK